MTTELLVFVVGVAVGVVASIAYTGYGEGYGDVDYTHYDFAWRGRRFELHVEKTA